MCGASSQQKQLEQSQADFYNQLQQENNTQFANQQGVLNQLKSVYEPILQAGPNQQGFSQSELTAMNTSAEDQVAGNYANAAKAAQGRYAAAGGGNEFVPSGAQQALGGQIASSAAGQLSNEQNQITQANYATGRQNFLAAGSALGGVAQQYNPDGAATAANGAGESAANTANQIQQENNAWMGALGGALGGAATGALTGGFGAGGAFTKMLAG